MNLCAVGERGAKVIVNDNLSSKTPVETPDEMKQDLIPSII